MIDLLGSTNETLEEIASTFQGNCSGQDEMTTIHSSIRDIVHTISFWHTLCNERGSYSLEDIALTRCL